MFVDDIVVTDSDIDYAERLLLNSNARFDDDRREFIKNFETIDLHAVPGSGKTTLLLAKLLVIEKNLPLKSGRGVLVISHTNTAVDEIRNKIEKYCPKLFSEPNFIGTIQSFVNKFLAIPYYESVTHHKILKIEDVLYNKYVENFYKYTNNYSFKGWINRKHDPLNFLMNIRLDSNLDLTDGLLNPASEFELKDKNSPSYKAMKDMKERILNKGILHYDDAYSLAFRYMEKHPLIIDIIRDKFMCVFVDEMQDMDVHQYKLLEGIFYSAENINTIYQRIGDNNQAIYTYNVKSKNVWVNRNNVLTINGSNRLKHKNACLVSKFSLDGSEVEGLNSKYEDMKPILYVYDNQSCTCEVIKRFASDMESIFASMNLQDKELIVKVISWRKNSGDLENKISLQSYCPEYANNKFVEHKNRNNNFEFFYSSILEYIISIFIKNKVNLNGDLPTKTRLINYIKDNKNLDIEKFKLNMYEWCLSILNKNIEDSINSINDYINFLAKNLGIENITFEDTIIENVMVEDNITEDDSPIMNNECTNCYVFNNKIEICSAHSVKGETHDATLFLESFYGGYYESDILSRVLNGECVKEIIQQLNSEIDKLEKEIEKLRLSRKKGIKTRENQIRGINSQIEKIKEYTKLVFVGISRSNNVVAYGMSFERYNKYMIHDMEKTNSLWDVRFILKEEEITCLK